MRFVAVPCVMVQALCWVIAFLAGAAAAADTAVPAAGSVFARIGNTTISTQEFEVEVAIATRNKYFHVTPPRADLVKLRREVGERMIARRLLVAEATQRGFAPDAAAIGRQLADLDTRYAGSPEWQRTRTERLSAIRSKLETDSLVEQLEQTTRNVPEPGSAAIERYFAARSEKFTEPEQLRVSLILLAVEPSSPTAKWQAARAEGEAIVKQLRGGADLAALARLHSSDPSAAKGGDLGYVHRGMLPEPAQDALDKLDPGAVADPVVLLEGVAVIRLDERRAAKRQPLPAVRDRVRDLVRREQGDAAWNGLIARLRAQAQPKVDESRYEIALTSEPAAAAGPAAR